MAIRAAAGEFVPQGHPKVTVDMMVVGGARDFLCGETYACVNIYTAGSATGWEPHSDMTRSWRESWEAKDFRFSRPLEFIPVIQTLTKIHKFAALEPASLVEKSEYSIFMVLEVDQEVTDYISSTQQPDWNPAKGFGA